MTGAGITAALVLFGYLSGSIPFGWIFFRFLRGGDIREHGSGNIGATNLMRFCGRRVAAIVLLLDALKGAVPVLLCLALGARPWVAPAAGVAALVGHCYPIWLGLRGGKAVATGLGVFAALAPLGTVCSLATFLLLVLPTRMISLGSLGAAVSGPGWLWILGYDRWRILAAAVAAVLVVWRHRSNIQRLLAGGESRVTEQV